MSKIGDTLVEFAGDNKELLFALGFNALVKAVTISLPKVADEAADLLTLATEAGKLLLKSGDIPQEEFEKQWKAQDDSVAHIIALANAD